MCGHPLNHRDEGCIMLLPRHNIIGWVEPSPKTFTKSSASDLPQGPKLNFPGWSRKWNDLKTTTPGHLKNPMCPIYRSLTKHVFFLPDFHRFPTHLNDTSSCRPFRIILGRHLGHGRHASVLGKAMGGHRGVYRRSMELSKKIQWNFNIWSVHVPYSI